jgi:hypothetical protein
MLERAGNTNFPLPTINLPTVNLPTSQKPEETTSVSPTTTEVYPTDSPDQCTDHYRQCPTWLEQHYYNDYKKFCERDGYDWWCCETCREWESGSGSGGCPDTGYSDSTCEDLLRWGVDNDKELLCDLFSTECCRTCSDTDNNDDNDKQEPGNCVDKGYGSTTCADLLDYGTDGDLDELCRYFSEECCNTCSGK